MLALSDNYEIVSIFFGGGTPSLANPMIIDRIINKLSKVTKFSKNIEITLEANPTSIDINNLKTLHSAGINRASVGIQSFNDAELRFLGREHSSAEALSALHSVANCFENYSFDMIYGLPNQTIEDWQANLRYASQFFDKHVSLYQLTIEDGTTFHRWHKLNRFTMQNDDKLAEFYKITQEIMEQYQMPAYEISNHAKPGSECKHNISYWKYKDYIAIGAGGHSRYMHNNKKIASINYKLPEKWLKYVIDNNNDGCATAKTEILDSNMIRYETILMNMRLCEGMRLDHLSELGVKQDSITALIDDKLIIIRNKGGQLYAQATLNGRLLLNIIISRLLEE